MSFSDFKTPEYLYQTTTGLFIFRMKVPTDCRSILNRQELQYSLKTRCIRTARKYIASILPFLEDVFNEIRSGLFADLNSNSLIIRIKKAIAEIRTPDCNQLIPGVKVSNNNPLNSVQNASSVNDLSVPDPSCSNTQETPFSTLNSSFLKEKELSNGWRLKTREDHEQVFSLFVEICGDIPVETIDKSVLRKFKSTVASLPPNMRKIEKYREKSITQIIKMKPAKTISPHTINKYLARLSNVFTYGVSHGYMNSNPTTGLKVKIKKRPDEEREAYTNKDLQKIFGTREFTTPKGPCNHSHKHSYGYWTPLIGLFTGCRLEEICQLHLEDIRKIDKVWVFDINDKKEKVLKSLSSSRLIPIHPKLIELGLLDHVDLLKEKCETRLFPELTRLRDGYSHYVSKWYRRFKMKLGFSHKKNFHSFRHTFITHLKHKQVDPFMLHELDGHTIDSETMGRYGKRYTPEILLREAIEKIDYGVDFS